MVDVPGIARVSLPCASGDAPGGAERRATGMRSPRLWLIVLLMSFTALVLHVRGDQDRVLPSLPLSGLPTTIGSRTAVEIEIPDEELQILGKGDFLNRDYLPDPHARGASPGDLADIGLFIAYFPTQRSGQSIHSPQHCLPGAGWIFKSSSVAELTDPADIALVTEAFPPQRGGKSIHSPQHCLPGAGWIFKSSSVAELTDPAGKKYRVGDYLITNGTTTDEALYWYQLHGRSIPGDYQAKLYTLADSIRYGRTDEALVRIITPVVAGEDRAEARDRALDFARQIAPLLPAYVPN